MFEKQGVYKPPQFYRTGIMGLKQYYAIALLDPRNAHAVSLVVDDFWHAHILHTRMYADFCDRVIGAFMHHIPLDRTSARMIENVDVLYHYTIEMMPRLFSNVDDVVWPADVSVDGLICLHFNKDGDDEYSAVTADSAFAAVQRGQIWQLAA